jgi:hypothetical protein
MMRNTEENLQQLPTNLRYCGIASRDALSKDDRDGWMIYYNLHLSPQVRISRYRYRVSGDFMWILQDLIPAVIQSQKWWI